MRTLSEAWDWYLATRKSLELYLRLGERHWDDDSLLEASIWKDDRFKHVEAKDVVDDSSLSLRHIDDLAIVVMFSMFESQVRDYLLHRLTPMADSIVEPILREAAERALDGIQEGSFSHKVLEPLKKQDHQLVRLITQVDQVRKYRNWAAHGRRGEPENNVTPNTAYARLKDFLIELGIAIEPERNES